MGGRVGVVVCGAVALAIGVAWGGAATELGDRADVRREEQRARYDAMAREALIEEIRRARDLLDRPHLPLDADTRGELRLRLAAAYAEMARHELFAALEAADAVQDACYERSEPEDCTALEPDLRGAHAYTRRALASYRAFLAAAPRHPRADEAWLRAGLAHEDLGETDEAIACYEAVVELRPDGAHADHARLALGEHHLDAGRLERARAAFAAAAGAEDGDVARYATYQLAWCWYGLGELDRAVDALQDVLLRSQDLGDDAQAISLAGEAGRDLVRLLAESGDVDGALAIVRAQGDRATARRMTWALGDGYAAHGRTDAAVRAYGQLLRDDPLAADAPLARAAIAETYRTVGQHEQARIALRRLIDETAPGGDWARAHADDAETRAAAAARVEAVLRRAALDVHRRGLDDHDAAALADAAALHATYLTLFPDVAAAYDIRFWYAEALFDLGSYGLAADEYERVVALDPGGKHLRDAAWNAIVAIERQIEVGTGR